MCFFLYTCIFVYKHDDYKHDEAHFGKNLSMSQAWARAHYFAKNLTLSTPTYTGVYKCKLQPLYFQNASRIFVFIIMHYDIHVFKKNRSNWQYFFFHKIYNCPNFLFFWKKKSNFKIQLKLIYSKLIFKKYILRYIHAFMMFKKIILLLDKFKVIWLLNLFCILRYTLGFKGRIL